MKLTSQKELQIQKLKDMATKKFDNSKNWSIMIDDKSNMVRNEVMQKIKFEQLKKRSLHDFIRKQKEAIIQQRQDEDSDQVQVDGKQLRAEFKKDFLKYFERKLTKGGAELTT